MSGFSDVFYAAATERLGATAVPGAARPCYYDTAEAPDVWFQPSEVWEIRGAELSISPVHRAAAGALHPERGLGLRFPRCGSSGKHGMQCDTLKHAAFLGSVHTASLRGGWVGG